MIAAPPVARGFTRVPVPSRPPAGNRCREVSRIRSASPRSPSRSAPVPVAEASAWPSRPTWPPRRAGRGCMTGDRAVSRPARFLEPNRGGPFIVSIRDQET